MSAHYSAGNFTPTDIAPQIWLEASVTTNVTESAGAVSQWSDTSGNAIHATGTGSEKPSYGASFKKNGLQELEFAADCLEFAGAASDFTFMHDGTKWIFVVVGAFGSSSGIFGNANGALTGQYFWNSGSTLQQVMTNNTTNVTSWNPAHANSGMTNSATVHHVISLLCDPGNGTAANRTKIKVDRVAQQTGNGATGTAATADSASTMGLGTFRYSAANHNQMTGRMGEVIIIKGAAATEANRDALHAYLQAKWAL